MNYDAQSATDEERRQMCAAVSAISMFLLEKTGKFDLPENLDIKFNGEIQGGTSSKGVVKLHNGIFGSPENFLNDISIVAHEITHIAQRHFKDKSKIIRNEDSLVCKSNHYSLLEYFIALVEFPQLRDIIQYYGVMAASGFSDELNDLHYYFRSFYDLQSFEMEANNFSIDVVDYIIKSAHNLHLTPTEKRNLKALEEDSKAVKDFYDTQDYMKNLRCDDDYKIEIKRYVKDLRQYFYESEPELMAAIKDEKCVDISADAWARSIVMALCLSLEIDYDEELAHNLYNSMLNSKQSDARDSMLFELALWTKLNLPTTELEKLENIYNNSWQRTENSNFSAVLNDKKRVHAERNAIDNNLDLGLCEFNLEK